MGNDFDVINALRKENERLEEKLKKNEVKIKWCDGEIDRLDKQITSLEQQVDLYKTLSQFQYRGEPEDLRIRCAELEQQVKITKKVDKKMKEETIKHKFDDIVGVIPYAEGKETITKGMLTCFECVDRDTCSCA